MGDWSMPQYYETARQNDIGGCDGRYYRESNDYSVHTAVENDEVIAHALQEEYSVIAMAEASGRLDAGNEHLQASVLAQDWHGSTARNAWSGNEGSPREEDDSGACSSSFREDSYEGERVQLDQIDDNASLDDEVDKRLNYMVSIPHIPKINGEIPTVDEATSDHQRLLDRLQLYDLVERKVAGDGNCQFRALSDQLYRTPDHHDFVRKQIVNQLKSRPDLYEGYVPMAYDEYLKKMSESGEWGDHVTLQAAADTYGVKLFMITSFKDTCYIEILPAIQKSERVIHLSFWSEVHYNSIYPEGDPDMPTTNTTETRRKKKWWQFG